MQNTRPMPETNTQQVSNSLPLEVEEEGETTPEQSKKTSKGILNFATLLLLVGIFGGGGWYFWQSKQASQSSIASTGEAPPAVGVKFMTLENKNIEDSSEYLGNLEAEKTVVLNSDSEGRIVEILVKEGQRVSQGQYLFRLESDTLQAELNQAEAGVKARQAQLKELQTGSRTEDIAAAQARLKQAQIRLNNASQGASQAEIAQAQAQLNSAQAEAKLAQQRVDRYEMLKDEGAISQDEFDDFSTTAQTATAQVDVAKKRLQELKAGTNFDIDELQAGVEEAKQDLARLENGARVEEIAEAQADVQEAKANVERIETLLDKTFVQAPISGKISNIPVKVGDFIDNEETLTTITENTALELNLAIPTEKAPQLEIGLPVQILDQNKNTISTGKINFIDGNVSADSQLVNVKAVFNNSFAGKLLNQQFITARIIWNSDRGVLIPTSSIFRIGGQAFVFKAVNAPETQQLIAKQQPIKLGDIQNNSYQVLEGLQAGDKILTAGILKVRDGVPIQQIAETDTNQTSSNN